jgi:hypothetical protein
LAKKTSDKPSTSAEEALKRKKNQARREAKLMLEIEAANKDLKKAQMKQSKAQNSLEARNTSLQTLEAKLAELRTQSLEPKIAAPPDRAEHERQQEPSELEGSIAHSDGNQQASPETEASTFTGEGQHDLVVEETTPSDAKVATNEVAERSEVAVVQDNETASESLPTPTTHKKTPAQKSVATRKPITTKRPTSSSQVTKRPANRSQSTGQLHPDAG